MIKKIFCIVILSMLFFPQIVFAEESTESEIFQEQQSEFKIKDFLKETKKYTSNFLENIDISEIFKDATKGKIDNKKIFGKILNLLGKEVKGTLKTLISILIIVLIHSLLKSITDGLEHKEVSKIIYYVEYILIVTIIMSSFSEILDSVKNSITDLIGFSQSLIPLLITLMLYTGSITTSSVLEPILLFLIQFIANLIQNLILPVVSIIVVLIVISKISGRIQITKLAKFMNTSIVWFLGIVLTLFVGVMSLEGTLTASVDGITAKTTKAAVSNLIPVVGKILGDSVDTVLGCGVVLKNAVGVVGVIVIIGICLLPIIKLATFSIMYSILSCVIEPLADEKIVKLIEEMSGIFKLLLAILCSVSVLLIIGVTLVIKISNSGMMYR